jgi:hypothetical protein
MTKIFLLLLLGLVAALYFPQSREVLVDYSRPLANPAYRWMTTQELNQIVEDLNVHQESRGRLPAGRGEFDVWMDRHYQQERSRMDAWGTRYRLEVRGDRYLVISAGPDGLFGTEDDLTREGVRLATARRR